MTGRDGRRQPLIDPPLRAEPIAQFQVLHTGGPFSLIRQQAPPFLLASPKFKGELGHAKAAQLARNRSGFAHVRIL